MNARAVNLDEFAGRLKAELFRDKRKSALLGAALVVAVFMAVRLATRSPSAVKGSAIVATPVLPIVADGDVSGTGTGLPYDARGAADVARIEHIRRLDRSLKRDLFAPNPKYFPAPKTSPRPAKVVATSQPGVDSAEAKKNRIRIEAEKMTVMSTMVSSNPTAVVDGKILGVGSKYNGFEVVGINAREVVMVKEGVKVMLPFERDEPGTHN